MLTLLEVLLLLSTPTPLVVMTCEPMLVEFAGRGSCRVNEEKLDRTFLWHLQVLSKTSGTLTLLFANLFCTEPQKLNSKFTKITSSKSFSHI